MMQKKTIFFDLDGTLLDTFPDLFDSINRLLNRYQKSSISKEEAMNQFSKGSPALLKKCFDLEENHEKLKQLREEYFLIYKQQMLKKTEFYHGIKEVLNYLDKQTISWGVVTNKIYRLAEPLLRHFNLIDRISCLIGGDTLSHPKPHPAPLLHACELAKIDPKNSLYIGDSKFDVDAASAANMPMVLACYGYTPCYLALKKSPSISYAIDKPLELIQVLEKHFSIN